MIARYYRSDVGWCEACTGVDFGGVCSSINTKLETIRSQPHFWRNETDSAVFTQWCVQYLPSVFLFSIRCLQSQSRLICKYFLFLHCFFTFSGYFFVLPFLFFFGQKNICSHGNEKYTTCIGGWSHNQSQCQIGYDGVLCGTCSSEVDIYTVVEESTVDSGVNGTNVNFFFWTIGENFFFFFFWSISEQFPSF